MELRPEEWEESMVDSIKLFLDPEDEEEDEEGSIYYCLLSLFIINIIYY